MFAARGRARRSPSKASEARRRVATSVTMLARWIGPARERAAVGTPDFATVPLRLEPTSPTRLAHHPQIAALAQQEALATAEVKVAQAERDPDWSVEVAYQQRELGVTGT